MVYEEGVFGGSRYVNGVYKCPNGKLRALILAKDVLRG